MKCPECGNDMIRNTEPIVPDWWSCPVCGNEEPYTEFDEDEVYKPPTTDDYLWRKIEEGE